MSQTRDDLFEPYGDFVEEEFAIDRNCQSGLYRHLSRMLESYLNVSLSSIISVECTRFNKRETSNRKSLVAKQGTKDRLPIWLIRLVKPIYVCIILYWVVKFKLLQFLHFGQDYLKKKSKDDMTMMKFANTSKEEQDENGCIMLSQAEQRLQLTDPSILANIDRFRNWLHFIGDPNIEFEGGPVLLYAMISWTVVFFFLYPLIRQRKLRMKLDFMAFMTDPADFRSNTKVTLDTTMNEMIESSNVYLRVARQRILNEGNHHVKIIDLYSNRYSLLQLCHPSLVKPVNLSSRWHRMLIYASILSLYLLSLSGLFFGFSASIILHCAEWYIRAAKRLQVIKCQKWIITMDLAHLYGVGNSSSMNRDDLELYEDHDGSLSSFLHLMFVAAPKYGENLRILITMIEIFIVFIFIALWLALYCFILALGFLDKYNWLIQLKGQLDYCIEIVASSNSMTDKTDSNDNNAYEESSLIKALYITYMNYSLFRKRYANFRIMANFVGTQLGGLIFVMLVTSYLCNRYNDCMLGGIIQMGMGVFLILANIWLFNSGFILNRITKLMKSINRLLAHSSSPTICGKWDPLMHLWRRELLDQKELNHFYATKLPFGESVTFDVILSLNSYLIGAWLILSKNRGFKVL